jgi:LuxR family maltose regulon positive regulatory protein
MGEFMSLEMLSADGFITDVETRIGHDQRAPAKNPLSAREAAVLGLIGHGLSNKRIARSLGIAPETVKSHAKNILAKLKAQTRAEAVALAAGWNLT